MDEYTSMKEEGSMFWGIFKKHVFALIVGAGTLGVLLTPLQGLGVLIPLFYYLAMWAFGWGVLAIYNALKDKGKDGQ
jgi:hypothetical protein